MTKTTKTLITAEDIKLYKAHNDITDAQFHDAMRFFHDELINEIKAERDFYKKLNSCKSYEEKTDQ